MQLRILRPEFAGRDCKICQEFLFDDEWGRPELQTGSGRMIRRSPYCPPLCRQIDDEHPHGRCPKGTPESQWDLSAQNLAAFRYHLTAKATGQWPDDERVRLNAEIIETALYEAESRRRWMTEKQITSGIMLVASALPAVPRVN